jgi:hypothetical protein
MEEQLLPVLHHQETALYAENHNYGAHCSCSTPQYPTGWQLELEDHEDRQVPPLFRVVWCCFVEYLTL